MIATSGSVCAVESARAPAVALVPTMFESAGRDLGLNPAHGAYPDRTDVRQDECRARALW